MTSILATVGRQFLGGVLILGALLHARVVAQNEVSTTRQAPPNLCAQFDVVAATVQSLVPMAAENGDLSVPIDLGGTTFNLVLRPHEVRAPGFQLIERDAFGEHVLPTPPSVTYRGSLLEDPASWVAATWVGGGLTAVMHTGTGDGWAVQPIAAAGRAAGPGAHIVYRTADNANLPWVCGVQGHLSGPVPAPISNDVSYICQIAIEADPAYYQLNGSNTTNTQNDITGVINATTAIYQADVQISFQITQIIVDTGADPYNTSVAGTLLGQFAANWTANRGNVTRDVAHLFTGRNMGAASGGAIGIAYVSTICNLGAAYGVSQSRWTNNFTRRVAVTAHEIGHNFSAQHCDAVPPCYIMCSGVGGCQNVQTTFSQNERNQITGFANSLSCLSIVSTTPVLTGVTPNTVSAFTPGIVQLTGFGFLGITQVHIGSQVITTGLNPSTDTALSINLPQPLAIGTVPVTFTNGVGTSNAISMAFTAASPPALNAPLAVLGGQSMNWTFAGQPNNVWVLLVSGVNTTSLFQGWPVLDASDIFAVGLLNSTIGTGSHSVTVPAGVLSGLTFYSQIGELQIGSVPPAVVGTTAARSTFVVN